MAEERKPGDVGGRLRTAVERKGGDFGSRLREARERKGVSLREIADATKIHIRALEALERNDISHLPGGIFSRAFVRAYAVEAGLNPEETVEDFVHYFPHDSVTAGHPPSTRIDDGDLIESNRRMASVVLRLLGISVPIAGVVMYFGVASHPAPAVGVQPAPQSATTRAVQPLGAPPAASGERATHLSIEVIANSACAVSAAVDGQPVLDIPLEAGGRRTFEASSDVVLTVSDPSAIEWTINGARARRAGAAGESSTVKVTLDNFKDFVAVR